MDEQIKRRSWQLSDVVVKRSEGDEKLITVIEGFAAAYGNVDSYHEIIDRGAFNDSIAEKLPQGLIKITADHAMYDCDKVIGIPVKLEDRQMPSGQWGLWFSGIVSSVRSAQDIATKMFEGILNRCSVSSHTTEWADDENRVMHNVKMDLFDIAIVPFAANTSAVVTGVRSDGNKLTSEELIDRLRELQPEELQKVRNALKEEETQTTEGVVTLATETEVTALMADLGIMG